MTREQSSLEPLDPEAVHLPHRIIFAFILMFVMAFGVFWEVVIAEAAAFTGGPRVLTQYSLGDTMKVLLFNLIGGFFVAVWGTAISPTSSALSRIDSTPARGPSERVEFTSDAKETIK